MKIFGWDVRLKERATGEIGVYINRKKPNKLDDHVAIWLQGRGICFVFGMDLWEGAPYDIFFNLSFFDMSSNYNGWHKFWIDLGWYGKHWSWRIPWNRAAKPLTQEQFDALTEQAEENLAKQGVEAWKKGMT